MNTIPNNIFSPPSESVLSLVSLTNIEVGKYYYVDNGGFWHFVKVTAIDPASNGGNVTGKIEISLVAYYAEIYNEWVNDDSESIILKADIGNRVKMYKPIEGGRRRRRTQRRLVARHRTRRHRRST